MHLQMWAYWKLRRLSMFVPQQELVARSKWTPCWYSGVLRFSSSTSISFSPPTLSKKWCKLWEKKKEKEKKRQNKKPLKWVLEINVVQILPVPLLAVWEHSNLNIQGCQHQVHLPGQSWLYYKHRSLQLTNTYISRWNDQIRRTFLWFPRCFFFVCVIYLLFRAIFSLSFFPRLSWIPPFEVYVPFVLVVPCLFAKWVSRSVLRTYSENWFDLYWFMIVSDYFTHRSSCYILFSIVCLRLLSRFRRYCLLHENPQTECSA